MNSLPSIAICGLGRLGTHLALQLDACGASPVLFVTRDNAKGEAIARRMKRAPDVVGDARTAVAKACLLFLTIPDGALPVVAGELAQTVSDNARTQNSDRGPLLVVHCSGAHPSGILRPLREAGALAATFHPMQSFGPDAGTDISPFNDIVIGVEGDASALPILDDIAGRLGARTMRIPADTNARALYHAAAVVAGNAPAALMALALELMGQAGVSENDAQAALMPLMRGAVENLRAHAPGEALTGPVVRGDIETIERHVAAMNGEFSMQTRYLTVLLQITELALASGRVDADSYTKLMGVYTRAMEDQSEE